MHKNEIRIYTSGDYLPEARINRKPFTSLTDALEKPAGTLPETIKAEAFQCCLLAKRSVGARAPLRRVL
jgi:hypothetical protein